MPTPTPKKRPVSAAKVQPEPKAKVDKPKEPEKVADDDRPPTRKTPLYDELDDDNDDFFDAPVLY